MGFIPRDQQIALMRCCAAMVQPSLFEGWSTVLEDARCLGVRIIASDLAVHIEQNLPAALYFERRNSEALSRVLAQHFEGFTTGPHIERERNAQILSESQLHQYGKNIVEIANRCLEIFSPQKNRDTCSVRFCAEVDTGVLGQYGCKAISFGRRPKFFFSHRFKSVFLVIVGRLKAKKTRFAHCRKSFCTKRQHD